LQWVIGSLFLAIIVSIATMRPASAALCAGWETRKAATAGSRVSISFRTYVPIPSDGSYTLEPRAFPSYPFRVQVVSPDGDARRVPVHPDVNRPTVWSGSFSPERPGSWRLQILNLADADAACYSDSVLLVNEARNAWNCRSRCAAACSPRSACRAPRWTSAV